MVLAHGIGGRLDLPIPLLYFALAAVTVLVVTFALLSTRWFEPRLQNPTGRVLAMTAWLRWVGGVVSIAAVGLWVVTILSGVGGSEDPLANPAPVIIYVGWWLVVPFLSALLGDIYPVIAPWRVLSRWLRIGNSEESQTPPNVNYWLAAVVLFGFAWWELVSPMGSNPYLLGWYAVLYATCMVCLIAIWGRRTPLPNWDGFEAYNYLMGAIGPFGRNREGQLVFRGWLRGLPMVAEHRGLDILVVVLIGGVTFDGLTGIPFWRNQLAGPLEDILVEIGLGWQWAEMLVGTFGLVATVLLIGWAYHIACALSISLSGAQASVSQVRIRFAHTLVPIALAYAFAHYFTLVLYEGQLFFSTISDPLDRGWDLFGTADLAINYTLISPTAVWYIQLAAVIAGHVGGVILAHDRALADFRGPLAVRSQYAMLVLMVALTMVALFILTAG